MGTSKDINSSAALLFDVPGSNSQHVVQERQIDGTRASRSVISLREAARLLSKRNLSRGFSMLRIAVCALAALLVTGTVHYASAQTSDAKPSRTKLTMEKLKEMKAKWQMNRPKLKACRKEVRAKGLAGDDRWFYIADCMDRT
jgi:hypothetical protein